MKPIEVRQRIESETLTLPELRPFIGKDVRITVVDESDDLQKASDEFWNPPSLEEQIRRQGVTLMTKEKFYGDFTDEDFEGFDEWIEKTRAEGKPRDDADDSR